MSKRWYQSKTLWTNISIMFAAFGVAFDTGTWEPLIPGFIGLVNVILRLVTSKEIT